MEKDKNKPIDWNFVKNLKKFACDFLGDSNFKEICKNEFNEPKIKEKFSLTIYGQASEILFALHIENVKEEDLLRLCEILYKSPNPFIFRVLIIIIMNVFEMENTVDDFLRINDKIYCYMKDADIGGGTDADFTKFLSSFDYLTPHTRYPQVMYRIDELYNRLMFKLKIKAMEIKSYDSSFSPSDIINLNYSSIRIYNGYDGDVEAVFLDHEYSQSDKNNYVKKCIIAGIILSGNYRIVFAKMK